MNGWGGRTREDPGGVVDEHVSEGLGVVVLETFDDELDGGVFLI
jgi:hypothetical protein